MAKNIVAATRLEPKLYKTLREKADDNRRSISDYLRLVIEDHLKADPPKQRIRA